MSLFFSRTFNLQNDIKSHCHIVLNIVSLLSNDFGISMHFFLSNLNDFIGVP